MVTVSAQNQVRKTEHYVESVRHLLVDSVEVITQGQTPILLQLSMEPFEPGMGLVLSPGWLGCFLKCLFPGDLINHSLRAGLRGFGEHGTIHIEVPKLKFVDATNEGRDVSRQYDFVGGYHTIFKQVANKLIGTCPETGLLKYAK